MWINVDKNIRKEILKWIFIQNVNIYFHEKISRFIIKSHNEIRIKSNFISFWHFKINSYNTISLLFYS